MDYNEEENVCLQCLQRLSLERLPRGEGQQKCPTCGKSVGDEEPPPTTAALDPPPAEAPPLREMKVLRISSKAPGVCQKEKAAALQEAQGVVRLVGVWCDDDPAWSLELLRRAAPTVERLEVRRPHEPHLRAAHAAMPRLRRLLVWSDFDDALHDAPPELGALPPGHGGLRWLSVSSPSSLPRATLQSLLRAHAGTLEELLLRVGTPGEQRWPWCCSDLHALLGPCRLRALRRLVLWRGIFSHTACGEQLAAVRAALPGVQVLCDLCDGVQEELP